MRVGIYNQYQPTIANTTCIEKKEKKQQLLTIVSIIISTGHITTQNYK